MSYFQQKDTRPPAFMNFKNPYSLFPLGDSALVIDFGNKMDAAINENILALFYYLKSQQVEGVTDLVPAYSTLTVHYDISAIKREEDATAYEAMAATISALMWGMTATAPSQKKIIKVPVCYSGDFAPDITGIARLKNISVEEVIHLHTSFAYKVYMIGFLPGFAYMGKVHEQIAVPRRPQPRFKVEAGSVGIAGFQTGIYPFASPGGWQIIGRTPLRLFNKESNKPVLLEPGDEVHFFSISEDEFTHY